MNKSKNYLYIFCILFVSISMFSANYLSAAGFDDVSEEEFLSEDFGEDDAPEDFTAGNENTEIEKVLSEYIKAITAKDTAKIETLLDKDFIAEAFADGPWRTKRYDGLKSFKATKTIYDKSGDFAVVLAETLFNNGKKPDKFQAFGLIKCGGLWKVDEKSCDIAQIYLKNENKKEEYSNLSADKQKDLCWKNQINIIKAVRESDRHVEAFNTADSYKGYGAMLSTLGFYGREILPCPCPAGGAYSVKDLSGTGEIGLTCSVHGSSPDLKKEEEGLRCFNSTKELEKAFEAYKKQQKEQGNSINETSFISNLVNIDALYKILQEAGTLKSPPKCPCGGVLSIQLQGYYFCINCSIHGNMFKF